MLPGAVTLERFEPVARRDPKILDGLRRSHLTKLAQCDPMDPMIDRAHSLTTPQSFGVLAPERSDHETRI